MGSADITLSYCMYSEYRDDVDFVRDFFFLLRTYSIYLCRYTILVDRYLKTHLLIFFKRENNIQGVCEHLNTAVFFSFFWGVICGCDEY